MAGLLLNLIKTNPEVLIDPEDLYTYMFCSTSIHNRGYVQIKYKGKNMYLHRAVMGNPREHIDHINRNKLDNRKENLRLCNNSQNHQNTVLDCTNTSGYKGVTFYKPTGKWCAKIRIQGVDHNLGYFQTKEEAAARYNKSAEIWFGEFAYLNKLPEAEEV